MAVKRLPALAIAAFVLLLALATSAAAAPTGPLGQNGRWVVDSQGRVAILHGVNMVFKRPPYAPSAAGFGADDARFLRENGFDTVRLGVIYKAVEPSPGHYDQSYINSIDHTVSELDSAGIFALVDFHQDLYNEKFQGEGWPDWAVRDDSAPNPAFGFPGNYVGNPALNRAFDHFWANDPPQITGGTGLQDSYAAAWRRVAERLGPEPSVLGYDILNEPWPGSTWSTCANPEGCPVFDQTLTAFSRRVTDRIREVDRGHIVWYEPNVIFNDGARTSHGDTGPNAGMSFHIYCLAEGNTPDPSPVDPVQQGGCGPFEDLPYQNAEDQSKRTGDALLLSEFGATDDLGNIERVVEGAEHHMVGWQYWHYCVCADPTTSGVGSTQALVIDASKPPTGANVKTEKLDVLSRVYPQAVAGTPTSYDYDREKKTFDLQYSTARVGGGLFASAVDTQVFVPPRQYPRGYDVVVEGAEPASKPKASALTLRTCTGRRSVHLRLAPGSGRVLADCRAPGVNRANRKAFRIRLRARPRRAVLRRRTRFHFRATIRLGRRALPVKGARIRFAHRRRRTGRRGRARVTVRLGRRGRYRAVATKRGLKRGTATVRVRRRR
jgi:endoglycosylceramidase